MNHRSRLSRPRIIGLVVIGVIVCLAFVYAGNLLLMTSNDKITVWRGEITLDAETVVSGNETLILDGAVIHNPSRYEIRVQDTGNVTLIHGATQVSPIGVGSPELQIVCQDNSTLQVVQSQVGSIRVYNTGGGVVIDESTIDVLYVFPQSRADTDMMVELRHALIHELQASIDVSGNFSLIHDELAGSYRMGVTRDAATVVEWPRYFLYLSNATAVIDAPAAKLEQLHLVNSEVIVKDINYTLLPLAYYQRDTGGLYLQTVAFDAYDSRVTVTNSCLGGDEFVFNLHGTAQVNVTASLLWGTVSTYDHSTLVMSESNADWISVYNNSTVILRDCNGRGWLPRYQDDAIQYASWLGIKTVEVCNNGYPQAIIENVTISRIHYDYVVLERGEFI
jgi:hypothetical protein